MHGTVTKQGSSAENIGLVVTIAVGFSAVLIANHFGLPQKWHAAAVGTAVPFGVVTIMYRKRWPRPEFWVSLVVLFFIHAVLIWVFFAALLQNVRTVGILVWIPVAFLETFVLLGLVSRLERTLRRLRAHKETQ